MALGPACWLALSNLLSGPLWALCLLLWGSGNLFGAHSSPTGSQGTGLGSAGGLCLFTWPLSNPTETRALALASPLLSPRGSNPIHAGRLGGVSKFLGMSLSGSVKKQRLLGRWLEQETLEM